ncbi:1994_t:CDS:1, partial [Dentiscutata heterogama]
FAHPSPQDRQSGRQLETNLAIVKDFSMLSSLLEITDHKFITI